MAVTFNPANSSSISPIAPPDSQSQAHPSAPEQIAQIPLTITRPQAVAALKFFLQDPTLPQNLRSTALGLLSQINNDTGPDILSKIFSFFNSLALTEPGQNLLRFFSIDPDSVRKNNEALEEFLR